MKQLHIKHDILEIRKSFCRRTACRPDSVRAEGAGWDLQAEGAAVDTVGDIGGDTEVGTDVGIEVGIEVGTEVGTEVETGEVGEVVQQNVEGAEETLDKTGEGYTDD